MAWTPSGHKSPEAFLSEPVWAKKIFVGIINKKNGTEMKRIAERFLHQEDVQYEEIHAQLQGFDVTFSTVAEALAAVELLDERPIHDAWKENATVRIYMAGEEADSIVSRMQKEVWILPEHTVTLETRTNAIMGFVKFWQDGGVCPKLPVNYKQIKENEDSFRASLVEILPSKEQYTGLPMYDDFGNKYGTKGIVKTVSSEAAVAASLNALPMDLYLLFKKKGFFIMASRACEYKHRYDTESVVLHLPTKWRTSFDEVDYPKWLAKLEDMKYGGFTQKLQEKVKNPKMRQILNFRDEKERDRFIRTMDTHLPEYEGVPVRVLKWQDSILYDYKGILNDEDRKELEEIVEGSPRLLQCLAERAGELDKVGSKGDNAVEIASDSCYDQINACALAEILFIVRRPSKGSLDREEIEYSVLLVRTLDYYQAALKRGETIRKFDKQLDDMTETFRASGGIILNDHLSFDSLDGITFYFWFIDEKDAKAAYRMVETKRVQFRSVIQQEEGRKISTAASLDNGFVVKFPKGETSVQMDLKEIARTNSLNKPNR